MDKEYNHSSIESDETLETIFSYDDKSIVNIFAKNDNQGEGDLHHEHLHFLSNSEKEEKEY